MARSTTTRMPRPEPDPFEAKAKANMIAKIMSTTGIGAIAFSTKSMFSTAVKYPDGKFKTKPIDQGEEFTLAGMRVGSKGQFLFEFAPIDAAEYVRMELDETRVFSVFPGMEKMIVEAMGLIAAPKVAGEHRGMEAYTWTSGSAFWLKTEKRRLRNGEPDAPDGTGTTYGEAPVTTAPKEPEVDIYADDPAHGSW